ncbi:hypothetical protein [Sorlinia euscelidii]|uniref:hypothetical protein n=1 Tax=Sorlinia euscelidii TaxID=3081148 RepID=UPI00374E01DE
MKLATGRISEFFGESFKAQDDVPKQTRMPGPPLLLVDRITGIDAPQGEIGAGSIWSETDVSGDGWYMHHGRMASGVLVETGQADLLLISWMGVDKFNEGQRVYRLLGCEITFHDALPKAGEILSHDIHIDRHVSAGSTRLFFFHSTCRVDGEKRLSITNGQAGFFTEEELNGSRGLFLPQRRLHRRKGIMFSRRSSARRPAFRMIRLRLSRPGMSVVASARHLRRRIATSTRPVCHRTRCGFCSVYRLSTSKVVSGNAVI